MKYSKKKVVGYIAVFMNLMGWWVSGVAVQLLARKVPDFQLGLLRYITATFLGVLILTFNKQSLRESINIPIEQYPMVIAMGILTNFYNLVFFFAVSILPLSHGSGFEYVFTMVAVAVLSRVMLGEKQSAMTLLAMVLCTLGLCLLLQPWKNFTNGFTPTFFIQVSNRSSNTANVSAAMSLSSYTLLGYIGFILSGIASAMHSIIAGVYLKDIKPTTLFFVTHAIATAISIVLCLYLEQPVFITEPYVILYVVIHVLGSGISGFCDIIAYQNIGPMQSAIIINFITVLNLIPQYTIFKGHLYGRMNIMEVLGCLIITISITMSGLAKYDETHEDFTENLD